MAQGAKFGAVMTTACLLIGAQIVWMIWLPCSSNVRGKPRMDSCPADRADRHPHAADQRHGLSLSGPAPTNP